VPDADYSKPDGYGTCRYPYSGLVGPIDIRTTDAHNRTLNEKGEPYVNGLLEENILKWLDDNVYTINGDKVIYAASGRKYVRCSLAPNYAVFSNTTSATQWNEDHFDVKRWSPLDHDHAVVPLESPHNDIHLAVGGLYLDKLHFANYPGANGDMGENNTTSFDLIFYFHH
jgi:tyrosinase